jgi:hypothetical protein
MECIIAPRCKSGVHFWSAKLHLGANMQCIYAPRKLFKTLLYNGMESRSAFMHQQNATIYNILYSIYIIIYYLFVVVLLGSYTFVSNKLVTTNQSLSFPALSFPLLPTHHSLFQIFSFFTPSFFISQP